MTTTIAAQPVQSSPARDPYRFGDGPELELQPGTMGWSAEDVEDPAIYPLWERGRYEILHGVLTVMPAAYFYGGEAAHHITVICEEHLRGRKVRHKVATEVDIQVRRDRVVRAGAVLIFGNDLPKLRALRFPPPRTHWRQHTLTIPPTLVLESVSQGHGAHDRQTKRQWYAEFGVGHYWIIDGMARTLECLLLDGNHYRDDGTGRDDEVVRPASIDGVAIPLARVWDDDEDDVAEDRQ